MMIKFLKAFCGDSILISFDDNQKIKRNILIDSGTKGTYSSKKNKGELYDVIKDIRQKNEVIDLLILTHIDNDHIGGVLEWMQNDRDYASIVRQVWFNSGKLIAKYFKEPDNPDLSIRLKIFNNVYTGVREAIDLEDELLKHNIWDRKIILQGQKISQFGVCIQVLAPNEIQLKELLTKYSKDTNDLAYTATKERDWDTDLKTFIKEEKNNYTFEEQKEPKNDSSIAIILTVGETKLLLLGDAPPANIVNALNSLGYTENNLLEVDLFKLSHHGSQYSTSKDLLKLVRTSNYVISTDGSGNSKHPDKRTLSRIIDVNPKATIYFNYEHVGQGIFSAQDFEDFKEFEIGTITDWKNGER